MVLHWNSTTCDSRVPSSFAACNLKDAMPTAGTTWPSFLESQAQCGNTMSPYPLSSLANFRYCKRKTPRERNGTNRAENLQATSFIQYKPRAFSTRPAELSTDTIVHPRWCDSCSLRRLFAKISKSTPARSEAYLCWKATSLSPDTSRWRSNNSECTRCAGVHEVAASSLQHNERVKSQINSPVNLSGIYQKRVWRVPKLYSTISKR